MFLFENLLNIAEIGKLGIRVCGSRIMFSGLRFIVSGIGSREEMEQSRVCEGVSEFGFGSELKKERHGGYISEILG